MQVFVCDTSSLINSPNSLNSLKCDLIVIPITAFEEIDKIKHHRDDAASVNARNIIRTIDKLQEEQGSSIVELGSGAMVVIKETNKNHMPDSYNLSKADNQILNVALEYQEEEKECETTLVSNDASMRAKARSLGLKVQSIDDTRINVRVDDIYKGWTEVLVPEEDINYLHTYDNVKIDHDFLPNEFVLLKNEANLNHTSLGISKGDHICKLRYRGYSPWDVKPKNLQQTFAMDLLLDPEIQVVSIIGKSGTGKTLLALAAGGDQVDKELYDKMIVYKPLIPVGRDVGFLPGELEDKIGPYMGSIYDNLEFMLGKPTDPRDSGNDKIDYYINSNKLELAALTFIRGRSLPNVFIVVDEAQNLSVQETKAIATRIGEGAKVVFVGDPYQIDHPFLDSQNNGLTYLTERLKGQPEFGTVTLQKQERSSVAEMCAELL